MSKSDATLESWEQKVLGGGEKRDGKRSVCQKMHQMHRVTRDESKSLVSYLSSPKSYCMYCATLSRHLSNPALYRPFPFTLPYLHRASEGSKHFKSSTPCNPPKKSIKTRVHTMYPMLLKHNLESSALPQSHPILSHIPRDETQSLLHIYTSTSTPRA